MKGIEFVDMNLNFTLKIICKYTDVLVHTVSNSSIIMVCLVFVRIKTCTYAEAVAKAPKSQLM